MAQNVLGLNVFTFYMSFNPFNNIDQSELAFGYIDNSKYEGEIVYHPVVRPEFWSIKLDEILYNGVSMNICSDRNCTMTPDSGTTFMTMPGWALDLFIEQTFEPDMTCS
jgi:hypothetical protein